MTSQPQRASNGRPVLIGCGAVLAASLLGAAPGLLFATLGAGGGADAMVMASEPEYDREMPAAPAAAAPARQEAAERSKGAEDVGRKSKLMAKIVGTTGDAGGGVVQNLWAEDEEGFAALDEPLADPAVAQEPADGVQTRQWFPDAFLWAPRVETGDDGTATLDVRVPDQLTTWRVLGLAHDRSGQQAGTVHTFDSRLPVYVEPVVPGWLYAGDVLELPVQAVNTTQRRLSGRLTVVAEGALSGGGEVTVDLGPGGSALRRLRLQTDGAGTATVRTTLYAGDDSDAAEREIPVVPAGRPVRETIGGSLSSARKLHLSGPKHADPATQELTVRVFPGPLAVLQTELERLQRGTTAGHIGGFTLHGAYGFALASTLAGLAERVGVEVDPKAVRKVQLLAWQGTVRAARAPDHGQAADLLLALGDVEGHALAEQLRPRLVHTLVQGQRGDGTWARQSSASLQQVLVQTAVAARALPDAQMGARLRAAGAIERYAREITDPYTAAVVLASGLADPALHKRLEKLIVDRARTRSDGARTVMVPSGVHNVWGYRPSQAEMLAFTALALAGSDVEWKGDLVAELMSGYDARWGFGAGPADPVALQAIAELLPGATAPVDVVLLRGGEEVARATVDPSQPMVPAVLVASARGADGFELKLASEVPGLAWVATLASWVPWTGDEALEGIEAEVALDPPVVGRDGKLKLGLAAPSGTSVVVEQGLPPGATVDEARLASLSGMLTGWEIETDRVRLTTRPFQAGEVMDLELVVQPAFAGSFQTVPLVLEADGRRVEVEPVVWTVAAASPAG